MHDLNWLKKRLSKTARFYYHRYGHYVPRTPRSRRRALINTFVLLTIGLLATILHRSSSPTPGPETSQIGAGPSLLALRETLYAGGYYDRLQEYLNSGIAGDPTDDEPRYPVLVDLQKSLFRSSRCPIYTYYNMDASDGLTQEDRVYDRSVLAAWMVYYSSLGFNPVVLDLDDISEKYARNKRSPLFGQARFARSMLRRTDLLENDLVLKLFTMQDHMASNGIDSAAFVDYHLFPMTGDPLANSEALRSSLKTCFGGSDHGLEPPSGVAAFKVDGLHIGSVSQSQVALFATEKSIRTSLQRLQRLLRRTATLVVPLPKDKLNFEFGDYSQSTITRLNPDIRKKDIADVIASHRHALFIENLNRRSTMDYVTRPISVGTMEIVDPVTLPGHLLSDELVKVARSLAVCPDVMVGLPTQANIARAKAIELEKTWALVNRARAKNLARDSDMDRLQAKIDSLKPKCNNLQIRIVDALDLAHADDGEDLDEPGIAGSPYSRSRFSLIAVPHPLVTVNALHLSSNDHAELVSFPYRNQFLTQLFKGSAAAELATLPERLALFRKVTAQEGKYRVLSTSLEFLMGAPLSEVLEAAATSLGFAPKEYTSRHGLAMAALDVEDNSKTLYVPTYAELVGGTSSFEVRIQALRAKMREARYLIMRASERKPIIPPKARKPASGSEISVDQLEPVTQPIPAIAESLNALDAAAWNSARVVEAIGRRVRGLVHDLQNI
ncbi:unnamed protein product [Kuraishia capsulata CBS 1993]|uniref:Uncharacterized protein n=1 Tax=Kuraishia capsulata CBS 1993 TaxID=1382522 RepID=W6MUT5_9ASCO|nr:uncharacterized protein KUCA_T00001876001 [Kuraishia capsulata CBS 1993]CDK25905.1 unnamed protein product [Kuraishia capsulata CBS 1993]